MEQYLYDRHFGELRDRDDDTAELIIDEHIGDAMTIDANRLWGSQTPVDVDAINALLRPHHTTLVLCGWDDGDYEASRTNYMWERVWRTRVTGYSLRRVKDNLYDVTKWEDDGRGKVSVEDHHEQR